MVLHAGSVEVMHRVRSYSCPIGHHEPPRRNSVGVAKEQWHDVIICAIAEIHDTKGILSTTKL